MNFEMVIPSTTDELLSSLQKLQKKKFRIGAGFTDLIPELKKQPEEHLTVINLAHIRDTRFTSLRKNSGSYRLGAMMTAHKIMVNPELKVQFPVLHQAAANLASTQIRQVATLGGNLCTASPSGDLSCALTALRGECEILETGHLTSNVPMSGFFKGVRQNILQKNEVLYGVHIPFNDKNTHDLVSGFIKVGTRRSMECSVVSLAYHIQLDGDGMVIKAGVAFGAAAPMVSFATSACEFLEGKVVRELNRSDREEFAKRVLSCASPITDLRATEWYRKEVLKNISQSILE